IKNIFFLHLSAGGWNGGDCKAEKERGGGRGEGKKEKGGGGERVIKEGGGGPLPPPPRFFFCLFFWGGGGPHPPRHKTEDNANAVNRRAGKQSAPATEQKTTPMQLTVGRVSKAHPSRNRR
ncbi:hypothetical protein CDT90_000610, partial [Cronobacter sakazakii]